MKKRKDSRSSDSDDEIDKYFYEEIKIENKREILKEPGTNRWLEKRELISRVTEINSGREFRKRTRKLLITPTRYNVENRRVGNKFDIWMQYLNQESFHQVEEYNVFYRIVLGIDMVPIRNKKYKENLTNIYGMHTI
jgi:hypothetical protein